ncbi:hypothetical protein H105_03862 [Trichophyton soudanense CBS 452.61]|uniref:Uncharacterized protein n=1 Tax=Trichophyton soudanense CBS 452.61 TaxID=1215331 RepID=A0A022XV59_TRISD|nr:hypothetical protein H105_03862 [Trichophyton soudanense CBS 452.61]
MSHTHYHHAVGFAGGKQCSGLSPPSWGLQTIARITSHARVLSTDGLCFEPGVSLKTGDPSSLSRRNPQSGDENNHQKKGQNAIANHQKKLGFFWTASFHPKGESRATSISSELGCKILQRLTASERLTYREDTQSPPSYPHVDWHWHSNVVIPLQPLVTIHILSFTDKYTLLGSVDNKTNPLGRGAGCKAKANMVNKNGTSSSSGRVPESGAHTS